MSNYRGQSRGNRASGIPKADITKIIADGNAQQLVESAEALGSSLGRDLGNSQVRALFGAVRRIEMNWDRKTEEAARDARRQLILLKPKMLYRTAKKDSLKPLTDALIDAIDIVTEKEGTEARQRFQYFTEFFEAILAYHTVAG